MVRLQFLHMAWLPVPDQGLRPQQKALLQRFLIHLDPAFAVTSDAVMGFPHVFAEFHFFSLAFSVIDSLHGEL